MHRLDPLPSYLYDKYHTCFLMLAFIHSVVIFYHFFVRKGSEKYSEIYSLYTRYTCFLCKDISVNPCHAGCFYVLHSSSIFIQPTGTIPVIRIYSQADLKTMWILISWLLRSQLIWTYYVFKMGYIWVQHEKG